MKKFYQANDTKKQAGVAVSISNKTNIKPKPVRIERG
jgi:phage shock protein PspC (stress-responsive transcriptional regulator)